VNRFKEAVKMRRRKSYQKSYWDWISDDPSIWDYVEAFLDTYDDIKRRQMEEKLRNLEIQRWEAEIRRIEEQIERMRAAEPRAQTEIHRFNRNSYICMS
jgi:cell shape-determining protein MreC